MKRMLHHALACLLLAAAWPLAAQTLPLPVPHWRWDASQFGNHRFVVHVDAPAAAVRAEIPWRRRDAHPGQVATIVVGPHGKPVANVVREAITRVSGSLVFEATVAGDYAVYYQPYVQDGRSNYPTVTYRPPMDTADAAWKKQVGADDPARWRKLPQATVKGYEAVDAFDAYTDMEFIATPDEIAALLAKHPDAGFLLFPETRAHPIRMFDTIPARWARRGAGGGLSDSADRDEYLTLQVGLWAARKTVEDVRVRFSDLRSADGARIPAQALTCFNLGGVAYTGRHFNKRVDVARGRVQALWMGLAVPKDAEPGVYRGIVTIGAQDQPEREVPLTITVTDRVAIAHGDNDPHKLTRLRWLDSTLAQNDEVVPPMTPVEVDGTRLGILGRDVSLDASGLPAQVRSFFDERMTGIGKAPRALFAAPVRLLVEDGSGTHALDGQGAPDIRRDGPARVHWTVAGHAGPLQSRLTGTLEADGTLAYAIALRATRATTLKDIRLQIPLAPDVARYELGLGRTGSFAPATFAWKWDVQNNQDGAWIGDVNAGLEFHLRDEHYSRPLNTNFYHDKPLLMPTSWDNGGKGGITFARGDGDYEVVAFSGPRTMAAGQVLRYDIVLRVTPFKTIKPAKHFGERYFHKYADLDAIKAQGANVINIHHATPINPWINYPFLAPDKMKAYVDAAHARGMRVKIYDTVRELSDHAPEMPALESLGHEVLSSGKGGGYAWLQEHMDGDYIAAWFVPEIKDAAVIDAGQSRWHNYYIEGLDWLARNIGIDGLYLDDVAYDRTTMKRVRKVLGAHGRQPLIDLHSANQFNPRDGHVNSALLYMGLFPYIDRLWFGEYFDYQETSPQYWLTEISGIPYGLMGEMLQDDGNPWRGMVFGMTSRLGWSPQSDPRPLWKLWDAFGITQSEMVGWWVHDAPVKTGRDDVLATSYVRRGDKVLVALASWAPQKTTVKLAIDWKALGLDRATATLVAPAVEGFQPAARFSPGDAIPVEPGKGWLLVLQ